MKKFLPLLLIIPLILVSCKKKDVTPAYTTDEMARDDLYNIMYQYYLWYDSMPTVNKTDYKDPYALLDAMMYTKRDRWSFIETYSEFIARYTGSFVGHGIRMGLDNTDKVRIVQIYSHSDLYKKGVRRGWIVKTLNGTALAPIFLSNDGTAYSNLIGPSTAGITNTFVFQTPAGKDSTITSTKSSFTLNTVLAADTLPLSGGTAGYIAFDQFIPVAFNEIDSAFTIFKAHNIKNLVVDLRYNGGGDMDILTTLASYIVGSSKFGSNFLSVNFNDKNTAENDYYKFKSVTHPVSVDKIIFITSRYTASASEDLINGLKPYFPGKIITVGDTTTGKPVGMVGMAYSTYYMFWPIMFRVLNSSGQGDFYDGLFPGKYVADDITHDYGDPQEACLKEAIYYLENGSFSSKGAYIYRKSTQFTEGSSRFNDLIIQKNLPEPRF
ncbi:MAG: S41 family peptidase [Bacteroidales bacterium]